MGTTLGIIGPNGAGKTTLINAILGMLTPKSGEITILGKSNHCPFVKQDIGFVGEIQTFYEGWTCEQNLNAFAGFFPKWDQNFALDLANRFQLPIDRPAKLLSKGDRAKLNLVQALAHHPKILIMDEPTAGLDPVVREKVRDVLWEFMNEDRLIICSTHQVADLQKIADELVFLRQGRVVLHESKQNLLDNWRSISCDVDCKEFPEAYDVFFEGKSVLITSGSYKKTLETLKTHRAQSIEIHPMDLDQISIHVLKGVHHVANS